MLGEYVGAGILNIITESLYDKPIVVFREYVQNSMDSIFTETDRTGLEIKIWSANNNLYFLDNGHGIKETTFFDEMKKIGASNKIKHKDMGYKGIGRLSGVPYCKKLTFVNIIDYQKSKYQLFTIDSTKYEKIKDAQIDSSMSFNELIDQISNDYSDTDENIAEWRVVYDSISQYSNVLTKTNSGFLVILQDITPVLKSTINSDGFFPQLQWLLPVNFDKELFISDKSELFEDLLNVANEGVPTIRFCEIAYNDIPIYRPITKSMLRNYVCKCNFQYAVGFHTFNSDKIYIDKSNAFSGIKLYIDNMLLCDESELLQSLDNYGLLDHTLNGQLQSVRGIGAMIYITDKISISSNARRTFIEVSDNDSLSFLSKLAEFVNNIYDTRYALSNYVSAKDKQNQEIERLKYLKQVALESLKKLAKENIELIENDDEKESFDELTLIDQKRIVKKTLSSSMDSKIKEYLKGKKAYNHNTIINDFLLWLRSFIDKN